ncbi:hypothetical protein [Candidatus Magnetaquicoccus inordinatus]|uniref:hypothetical protein n=1 Tax=Candidatus Magnetaquicoccus inordinatus TaxID=2496818 RepID=UPI00102D1BB7|nr:hypothetical protein [Candidatus Magnetaquicoccus inordinatus]
MNTKLVWRVAGLFYLCSLSTHLVAGPVADATYAGLSEARQALVSLLAAQDQQEQNRHLAAVKSATAKVDTQIRHNSAVLNEFSSVWQQFKETRDKEIIPLLQAGKRDDAKKLAGGVQADRMAKMLQLLSRVPK